jgi:methionine salvage enolase-phosphatase E1
MNFPSSEAAAATEAGLNVVLMIRPGNTPLPECDASNYRMDYNFDQF